MKRRHWILTIVIGTLLALGIWRGPTLWTWVTIYDEWYVDGDGPSLIRHTWNWITDDHVASRSWYVESGIIRFNDRDGLMTWWDEDGRVEGQYRMRPPGPPADGPPWQGGMTNRHEPTAPWLEVGVSVEEWWTRVRPEGPSFREALASAKLEHEQMKTLDFRLGGDVQIPKPAGRP